jgi:hypothetical protein
MALYYLCAIGGLLLILGSIVLLSLRKTLVDKETSQPTEIEVPLLGKVRVNSPALVLFAVGIIPLVFAVWDYHKLREKLAEEVSIVGTVTTDSPEVQVYAVVALGTVENTASPTSAKGTFRFDVPLLGKPYEIYYVAQNGNALVVMNHASADLDHKKAGDEVHLDPAELAHLSKPVAYTARVAATPQPRR